MCLPSTLVVYSRLIECLTVVRADFPVMHSEVITRQVSPRVWQTLVGGNSSRPAIVIGACGTV